MHSRNNRCGMLIGHGMAPEDAVREVGMVVEGLNALPAALALGEKYRVELPIIEGRKRHRPSKRLAQSGRGKPDAPGEETGKLDVDTICAGSALSCIRKNAGNVRIAHKQKQRHTAAS